ncbi:MAG: FkbM family methyltransferase [Anaerolineaceae bacterium]|nr:FkbM family methyltransferase [Anaerolineaceae bacterium]
MLGALKSTTKYVLRQFNLGALRYDRLQKLEKGSRAGEDIELLVELPPRHSHDLMLLLHDSSAEFRQDLFVLSELDFKRDGYFVEFGATDGITTSNTYLLNRQFGWRGILAEPARRWHEDLKRNRSCDIETSCVWKASNQILQFKEHNIGECSSIVEFSSTQSSQQRHNGQAVYDVPTISLVDLLAKYNTPSVIDYLSIDTEGSEYEILSSFDFSKYKFRVITCEHNYTSSREKVYDLLTGNGYERKLEKFSKVDDWYVLRNSQ